MKVEEVGEIIIGEKEEEEKVVLILIVGELMEGVEEGKERERIKQMEKIVKKKEFMERNGKKREVEDERI